jgi:nicotinate-nucleotide pyrophosphorylase (carboxylating)
MHIPPNPEFVTDFILKALAEDVGPGDHSTLATIAPTARGKAQCKVKGEGVLAGVAVAQQVFTILDPTVAFTIHLADGALVQPGMIAFDVEGPIQVLLTGERLALNVLQRMSGIATFTNQVVRALAGTPCKVLDTRKTTPLFRAFEKWAVQIGGGTNHRFGLYDMIMLKDNHIDYAGGIANAVKLAVEYRARVNPSLRIEVETRNLAEVQQALDTQGADVIMLDNMGLADMRAAVQLINGQCKTEASGNLSLANVRDVALTGVDYVSMGALTHSYSSMDISLKAEVVQ